MRGQRLIYFFLPLHRYPPPLGGRITDELSQIRGACREGGLRRSLLCWCRRSCWARSQRQSSTDPEDVKGAAMWIFKGSVKLEAGSWAARRFTQVDALSAPPAPALLKQQCSKASNSFENSSGVRTCVCTSGPGVWEEKTDSAASRPA